MNPVENLSELTVPELCYAYKNRAITENQLHAALVSRSLTEGYQPVDQHGVKNGNYVSGDIEKLREIVEKKVLSAEFLEKVLSEANVIPLDPKKRLEMDRQFFEDLRDRTPHKQSHLESLKMALRSSTGSKEGDRKRILEIGLISTNAVLIAFCVTLAIIGLLVL